MKSIRENAFESNSSSVHSLTLVSKEEYEDFEIGKTLWDSSYEKLLSLDEVYSRIVEDGKRLVEDEGWLTPDDKARIAELLKVVTREFFDANIASLLAKTEGRLDNERWEDNEEYNLTDDEEKLFELLTWIFDGGLYDKEGYFDNGGYEHFEQSKNVKGVDVVAFGYYGYD